MFVCPNIVFKFRTNTRRLDWTQNGRNGLFKTASAAAWPASNSIMAEQGLLDMAELYSSRCTMLPSAKISWLLVASAITGTALLLPKHVSVRMAWFLSLAVFVDLVF